MRLNQIHCLACLWMDLPLQTKILTGIFLIPLVLIGWYLVTSKNGEGMFTGFSLWGIKGEKAMKAFYIWDSLMVDTSKSPFTDSSSDRSDGNNDPLNFLIPTPNAIEDLLLVKLPTGTLFDSFEKRIEELTHSLNRLEQYDLDS